VNPDLDLALERVIKAPRATVWNAWTDPAAFARWWLPAPTRCRVERLDVRPGGGLVTSMSEDSVAFVPHSDRAAGRRRRGGRLPTLTAGVTGGRRGSASPRARPR
jgi:hypothetical protein